MNVQEKLKFFSKEAFKEAVDQKNELTGELDEEFDKAVAKASELAERQAAERLRNESYKIEQIKNKEIVKATTDAKKEWIQLKSTLEGRIFENVKSKLRDFVASDSYQEYLFGRIKAEAEKIPGQMVILMSADMKYAAAIREELHVEVAESDEDFIGGFKLYMQERNGLLDFSLSAGIEEERAAFDLPRLHRRAVPSPEVRIWSDQPRRPVS